MKAFKVTGSFPMGRLQQTFSVEIAAEDEAGAREKIVSDFGSKHYAKRRFIKIATIEQMKPADVKSHVIQHLIGGSK